MSTVEENARDFLSNSLSSYRRLAQHLNNSNPRTDGVRWTKDSAYHLCRKNGIRSPDHAGINRPQASRSATTYAKPSLRLLQKHSERPAPRSPR